MRLENLQIGSICLGSNHAKGIFPSNTAGNKFGISFGRRLPEDTVELSNKMADKLRFTREEVDAARPKGQPLLTDKEWNRAITRGLQKKTRGRKNQFDAIDVYHLARLDSTLWKVVNKFNLLRDNQETIDAYGKSDNGYEICSLAKSILDDGLCKPD